MLSEPEVCVSSRWKVAGVLEEDWVDGCTG